MGSDQLRSSTSKSQDSVDEFKTQSSKIVDEDKEMTANVVSVDKHNVEESNAESVRKYDEKVDLKVESGEVQDSNVTVKSDQPSLKYQIKKKQGMGRNSPRNSIDPIIFELFTP
ncbi:hypothetical protein L1987_03181 [Smallanthus sonchifolius]|uniref:Uncharacterized protein n=2 Tax=Smallanthus sonchifolius TaxID=185202 RepID=A0ACB9K9U5_9ASTR|nr:hypothetical protein L1987_86542 [Smallanthus sonchifolius]KAI3829067.1 hypothetical protein L1987_03181 [Smallanthus sonchifolius]